MAKESSPILSICIATRNRAEAIGPTLDALIAQCPAEVELVVVDGASTDATSQVVGGLAEQHACLRYFPQQENSGIDGDFDKAIQFARGEYCWLLSDDDIPLEGALQRVLNACAEKPAVVVVDAEVYSADLSRHLKSHRMPFSGVRRYQPDEQDRLLIDCGDTLSFIGALIIRRSLWLERERTRYYGTEFVHVGVVFQAPLPAQAIALGMPLLRIRYGVGNWLRRSFEVWMFKWPKLIWSFEHIAAGARQQVTVRQPWRSAAMLLLHRAKGWYTRETYVRLIRPAPAPLLAKLVPAIIALLPGPLVHAAMRLAMSLRPVRYAGSLLDLKLSPYAPKNWFGPRRDGRA